MVEAAAAIFESIFNNTALVALLTSVATAIISYKLSQRNNRQARNMEKGLATCDDALSLLTELRGDPSLVLNDDFYLRLTRISVRMRAYCDKKIYKSMRHSFDEIQSYIQDYKSKTAAIYEQYLEQITEIDPVTGIEYEAFNIFGDPEEYEAELKQAYHDCLPTYEEVARIVNEFAGAVSDYLAKN